MYEDPTEITLREVEMVLSNIENKYSPVKNISANNSPLEENLVVLSREFDSIGLSPINYSHSLPEIFEDLVCNARRLVQIHRKTLAQMKDTNITIQNNNVKNNYLHKVVENCHSKMGVYEDKSTTLQNKVEILEQKVKDQRKRETDMKNEMKKLKILHAEQNNEYLRKIKQLSDENNTLKEGSKITTNSKDESFLKFLGKYKKNEEIYKSIIKKLEENNQQLVREIMDMKCKIHH